MNLQIKTRALVLACGVALLAPVAMAQQLHQSIPQSSLKILSPGRHLTPIERPDEIAHELRTLATR